MLLLPAFTSAAPSARPPPLPHRHVHSRVAVLVVGLLRHMEAFLPMLDGLLANAGPFASFFSTDNASLGCLFSLRPPSMVWAEEDTSLGKMGEVLKLQHEPEREWAVLYQFWRLRHAWRGMESYEERRGARFGAVAKLRSDLRRLPLPLPVNIISGHELFMRGDWYYWGSRYAMRLACDYATRTLPALVALTETVGDDAYWPLPWRKLLLVGEQGLNGHFWRWLNYPKLSVERPYGFTRVHLSSERSLLHQVAAQIDALEEMERNGSVPRKSSEVISAKPFNTNVYAARRVMRAPEPEKGWLYHILSSGLAPRPAYQILANTARARGDSVIPWLRMLDPLRRGLGACGNTTNDTRSSPKGQPGRLRTNLTAPRRLTQPQSLGRPPLHTDSTFLAASRTPAA